MYYVVKHDAHVTIRKQMIAYYLRVVDTAINFEDADVAYRKLESIVGKQEARALHLGGGY